jgi:hypothetical protein
MRPIVLLTLILLALPLRAETLDLPPRSPEAPSGSAIARAIAPLGIGEREERVLAEVTAGNVPSFLRALVPVTARAGSDEATYHVVPDYLAVGSDADYVLMPLSPATAQTIADRLGCMLPTPKMADDIYTGAAVKLTPEPIAPSPAMTTVAVFLDHNARVRAQRERLGKPPGPLVAGHKKDVVISQKVFDAPGKVAIYGWHRLGGTPIQPLYTGHTADWVDYSHGIRLVLRRMTVNGSRTTADLVLSDPRLAPLLSNEGVLRQTRYGAADTPAPRTPPPGTAFDILSFDRGVRVVIDRPSGALSKPPLLVFYALPNGHDVEQTIGRMIRPGDDWRLDIQHIGAQTRFLRSRIHDRDLVVAYLQNDLRSWPGWRRVHGDAPIAALLDAVAGRFPGPATRIALTGHSGGGSLIFGYLNQVEVIPDRVERIAFLDANYAYETERHRDKLLEWLGASASHYLVVLAYNDAVALLNGKTFVSAAGGTWGRSHQMLGDFEPVLTFTRDLQDGIGRHRALDGRVKFLLKENPERKILHTVQVERNGFIESLLAGTRDEGVGYEYFGDRAYDDHVSSD